MDKPIVRLEIVDVSDHNASGWLLLTIPQNLSDVSLSPVMEPLKTPLAELLQNCPDVSLSPVMKPLKTPLAELLQNCPDVSQHKQ